MTELPADINSGHYPIWEAMYKNIVAELTAKFEEKRIASLDQAMEDLKRWAGVSWRDREAML